MIDNMKKAPWIKELDENSKVLVIHHWDSDGISSAVLITSYIKRHFKKMEIEYAVPAIGTYNVIIRDDTADPGNITVKDKTVYAAVIILDYSVPYTDIIEVQKTMSVPVIVYDHHLRKPIKQENIYYCNPVANGEPGEMWPSCTWVLRENLGLEVNNSVVFGIAGDIENRFFKSNFRNKDDITKFLERTGKKYADFVKIKDLIDIHYKLKDMDTLENIVEFLYENKSDTEKILSQDSWLDKNSVIEQEILYAAGSGPNEKISDKIAVYHMKSEYNIISAVTRRLAANNEFDYYMVVNDGLLADKLQIYIRRSEENTDIDTDIFRSIAKDLGAQIGGKKEVAGIIMAKAALQDFLKMIKKTFP